MSSTTDKIVDIAALVLKPDTFSLAAFRQVRFIPTVLRFS